jgi:hypothetical protein
VTRGFISNSRERKGDSFSILFQQRATSRIFSRGFNWSSCQALIAHKFTKQNKGSSCDFCLKEPKVKKTCKVTEGFSYG